MVKRCPSLCSENLNEWNRQRRVVQRTIDKAYLPWSLYELTCFIFQLLLMIFSLIVCKTNRKKDDYDEYWCHVINCCVNTTQRYNSNWLQYYTSTNHLWQSYSVYYCIWCANIVLVYFRRCIVMFCLMFFTTSYISYENWLLFYI